MDGSDGGGVVVVSAGLMVEVELSSVDDVVDADVVVLVASVVVSTLVVAVVASVVVVDVVVDVVVTFGGGGICETGLPHGS